MVLGVINYVLQHCIMVENYSKCLFWSATKTRCSNGILLKQVKKLKLILILDCTFVLDGNTCFYLQKGINAQI